VGGRKAAAASIAPRLRGPGETFSNPRNSIASGSPFIDAADNNGPFMDYLKTGSLITLSRFDWHEPAGTTRRQNFAALSFFRQLSMPCGTDTTALLGTFIHSQFGGHPDLHGVKQAIQRGVVVLFVVRGNRDNDPAGNNGLKPSSSEAMSLSGKPIKFFDNEHSTVGKLSSLDPFCQLSEVATV